MVNVEQLKVKINNLEHITNSYIVYDENKEAILIDPGDQKDIIIRKIDELKLDIKYVLITHVHADHIGALADVLKVYNCKVIIQVLDIDKLYDRVKNCSYILDDMEIKEVSTDSIIQIKDLYKLKVGNMEFEIIHSPGHTSGSMCIYEKKSKSLFSGDTIFENCYGRCDLYSSSFDDMLISLRKIFDLYEKEEGITLYPGHGKIIDFLTAKKKIKLFIKIKNKIDL